MFYSYQVNYYSVLVYTKTIMLIMVNKMMTLISSAKSMYMYMLKYKKKIETLLRFDFDIKDVLKHLLFSGYGMILVGLNSYSV